MRLHILGGTLILLLTSACGSVPRGEPAAASPAAAAPSLATPGPRHADTALAMDSGRVQLNVKGGYYSNLETRSDKEQSYALVLERINQHPSWGATQTVCVKGTMPDKMVCLQLGQKKIGAPGLGIKIAVGSDNSYDPVFTALDGDYHLGQEVIVNIVIGTSTIVFSVDGKPVFTQPIDFATDRIRFACASGECVFTML